MLLILGGAQASKIILGPFVSNIGGGGTGPPAHSKTTPLHSTSIQYESRCFSVRVSLSLWGHPQTTFTAVGGGLFMKYQRY